MGPRYGVILLSVAIVLLMIAAAPLQGSSYIDQQPNGYGCLYLMDEWNVYARGQPDMPSEDWTGIAFDDSEWEAVSLDDLPASLASHDGLVFLRKSVRIPASWEGHRIVGVFHGRAFQRAWKQPLHYDLYVNGHSLYASQWRKKGKRGKGPMQMRPGQAPARMIVDLLGNLKCGEVNVFAIRLFAERLGRRSRLMFCLVDTSVSPRVRVLVNGVDSTRLRALLDDYAARVRHLFGAELRMEYSTWETSQEVRDYLRNAYQMDKIAGAILVGDLPKPRWLRWLSPLIYEDLDATLIDSDGDGVYDRYRPGSSYAGEIWSSWVPSSSEEELCSFFEKCLRYYQQQLVYPKRAVVYNLPSGGLDIRQYYSGVLESHPDPARSGRGYYDALAGGCEFIAACAHGGALFDRSPLALVGKDSVAEFRQGSLVTWLHGCKAADLSERCIGPSYLFSKGNGLTLLSYTKVTGGAGLPCADLFLALSSGMNSLGPVYALLVPAHGKSRRDFWYMGPILLGNPFVDLNKNFSGPSATIEGHVRMLGGPLPVGTYYVEARRSGELFGRARAAADGRYVLSSLLPGQYELTLHVNPFETVTRAVKATAGEKALVDLEFERTYSIQGKVFVSKKQLATAWVALLRAGDTSSRRAAEKYAHVVGEQGTYGFHGLKPGQYILRAAAPGMVSETRTIEIGPGFNEVRKVDFHLVAGGRIEGRIVTEGKVELGHKLAVRLEPAPGAEHQYQASAEVRDDGRFVFKSVPPGEYIIVVRQKRIKFLPDRAKVHIAGGQTVIVQLRAKRIEKAKDRKRY